MAPPSGEGAEVGEESVGQGPRYQERQTEMLRKANRGEENPPQAGEAEKEVDRGQN